MVSSHILRFAIAMRAFTSLEQSPSVDLREPRYLNCFTFNYLGSLKSTDGDCSKDVKDVYGYVEKISGRERNEA